MEQLGCEAAANMRMCSKVGGFGRDSSVIEVPGISFPSIHVLLQKHLRNTVGSLGILLGGKEPNNGHTRW